VKPEDSLTLDGTSAPTSSTALIKECQRRAVARRSATPDVVQALLTAPILYVFDESTETGFSITRHERVRQLLAEFNAPLIRRIDAHITLGVNTLCS
jgi:hypothetical protein